MVERESGIRLDELEARMVAQEEHWAEMKAQHKAISSQIDKNTRLTEDVSESIGTITEFLSISKGAVRFFIFLANLGKFIVTLGGAIIFVYYAFKGKFTIPPININ